MSGILNIASADDIPSIIASVVPLALGLVLFTNKISGAVAGVIGALILLLPKVLIYISIKRMRPNIRITILETITVITYAYYPVYFVVVLLSIISSMLVTRQ
jgi:F0F1-type ATP synthase assembly protein I